MGDQLEDVAGHRILPGEIERSLSFPAFFFTLSATNYHLQYFRVLRDLEVAPHGPNPVSGLDLLS